LLERRVADIAPPLQLCQVLTFTRRKHREEGQKDR
jgi:hypothetical protein